MLAAALVAAPASPGAACRPARAAPAGARCTANPALLGSGAGRLRAIKRYLATRTDALPWLFVSERCQPLTRQAVNYLIGAAAERASLPGVHPHTLRHSCGFALADKGHDLRLIQDYLGHRDPRHTVHYTRTAARRFEGLWSR